MNAGTPNDAHAFALNMVGWNRHVLEIGAASGLVTRALVAQNCRVTVVECDPQAAAELHGVAGDVIVGDLNDPGTFAKLEPNFDVALAAGVLGRLVNPHALLCRMTELLAPGGRVVFSVPNSGHADVRLALLQGRFDHTQNLFDHSAIRFFTLNGLRELVKRSGLAIIDLMRVRVPAFETEFAVDRQSVATAVLDEILADPEAETYQFVFTAVRDDAQYQTTRLASMCEELRVDRERRLIESTSQTVKLGELSRQLDESRQLLSSSEAAVAALRRELDETRQRLRGSETELAALHSTRTLRYTRWPRSLYNAYLRRRA